MVITKSQLARELGISRQRVSQLVKRGLPTRSDGYVDLQAACEWVVANLDMSAKDNSTVVARARDRFAESRSKP